MQFIKQYDNSHVLIKDNYHDKRRNCNIVIEEVVHNDEYVDEQIRKRKLMYAMHKRDQEAIEKHKHETHNGYCPHCYMQIPLSGVCDCGYVVQRRK